MKGWIQNLFLGQIAKGLYSGAYGPIAQKLYRFGKGYGTWVSAALSILFYAASQFDNSGAALAISQLSAGLAGLALVRKGAHLQPPELTDDMRHAFEAGASVVTWLLMAASGVVWACGNAGASWACGVSEQAKFAVAVLTAVSGFLATYVSKVPEEAK